jgi:hypothetical protein
MTLERAAAAASMSSSVVDVPAAGQVGASDAPHQAVQAKLGWLEPDRDGMVNTC